MIELGGQRLTDDDLPGRTVDEHRAGKAFMLRGVQRWHGVRCLDDPLQTRVAERSRCETFARLAATIEGTPAQLRVR